MESRIGPPEGVFFWVYPAQRASPICCRNKVLRQLLPECFFYMFGTQAHPFSSQQRARFARRAAPSSAEPFLPGATPSRLERSPPVFFPAASPACVASCLHHAQNQCCWSSFHRGLERGPPFSSQRARLAWRAACIMRRTNVAGRHSIAVWSAATQ